MRGIFPRGATTRMSNCTTTRKVNVVAGYDVIKYPKTDALLCPSGKQVFLFGSFVTGKASPNDIDLLVVMNGAFSTANVSGQDLNIFQHDLCRIRFHADLFWVTESVGADRIEDLLDVFSRNRDGRPQPIIEVQL